MISVKTEFWVLETLLLKQLLKLTGQEKEKNGPCCVSQCIKLAKGMTWPRMMIASTGFYWADAVSIGQVQAQYWHIPACLHGSYS